MGKLFEFCGGRKTTFALLLFVALGNAAMQAIGWFNDAQVADLRNRKNRTIYYSPTVTAFIILGAIITVFAFHAINQINDLESLDFGYLTLIFSLFYISFGMHQLFYMGFKKYAENIDIDRFFIVLGFTAKIVLSWTYIAISRSSWDELGKPYDDKVPWENSDDSISSWKAVETGLGISALVILGLEIVMEWNGVCQKMCGVVDEDSNALKFKGNRFGSAPRYSDGPQEDDALLRNSKRRLNF